MQNEGPIVEKWTDKRREVLSLIEQLGLEEGKREARRRGMGGSTVTAVAKAYEVGESPDAMPEQRKLEKPKAKKVATPAPLLSATITTQNVALPYQVVDYYDRMRAYKNYTGSLAQFITECCEVCVVDLAGLPPTQLIWGEEHDTGEAAEHGQEDSPR